MTLISMKAIANAAFKELARLRANCDRCQNPLLKKRHTCGASTLRKDRAKEDLTKLTDAALEERIFYSQDARAGEPFGPLFEEYRKRYHAKRREVTVMRDEALVYGTENVR